tara:strand:+ start:418 stop:1077 length:660 start_codon:yes stop_codon:yes gene_type:complete
MDNWKYPMNKKRKLSKNTTESKEEDSFRLNGALKEGNIFSTDNHIYLYSEITKKNMYELNKEIRNVSQKLLDLKRKYNTPPPIIYLHINSYGGSIFASMAAIDTILDCPVDIHTIVEGCAASAATLISVVGKKRYIRRHAHMLIHQLSTVFWGKMAEFEDEMDNLNRLMELIKGIYKEHSKVPTRKLDEVLKHDLWWDADYCLENSLVDEIVDKTTFDT